MYSAYSINVSDYKSLLDILKERSKPTKSTTSSLPLAAFWYPERNGEQKNKLFQGLGINNVDFFDSQKAEYNFEYPTPAYKDGKSGKTIKYSKSSMTDLMILLNDEKGTRITIEAKYTEYVEDPKYSKLLKDWYEEEKPHKEKILQCWIDYIKKDERGCGHISSADVLRKEYSELPYQFLHRTASACFNCNNPILVYQLFYDAPKDAPKESTGKLEDFKKLLSGWAKKLQLKLPFFIVETEVKKHPDSAEWNKYKKNPIELFIKMIDDENLYTFGKEITVLNGYDLKQATPKQ